MTAETADLGPGVKVCSAWEPEAHFLILKLCAETLLFLEV
jgi:hypothetical protein